jgi:nicotinamide mononucleotide transporter
MTEIELIASFFLLICVWLSARRNIWTWPTGIIGVGIFFYICFESQLYADMWLQVVFLAQSIYGWHFWIYGTSADQDHVPIRKLDLREQGIGFLAIITLIILVGYLSNQYTDTDVPYLDATVASMSLIANILLARKVIDNWILWIVADVMYIGLFYYKGLYVTSALYIIFLGIATSGLLQWQKEWRLQQA